MADSIELPATALRDRLKQVRSPIIVGVSGDSGSGKTTFSNGIRRLLGSDIVSTICTDGYHKEDREQRQKSGRLPLDPDANHLDLLEQHLSDLKQGKAIAVPIYNHATGKFDPPEPFPPTPIIIVEGLHVLYPQFLPYLDFSLYVAPDREVKWQWKWDRDVKKRGHKAEALEQEMLQREATFLRWIDAQKIDANVVIQVGYSELEKFLPARFSETKGSHGYKVSLILEPTEQTLPSLSIPFDLASEFLPPNWQPVPAHKEKRGNINVVWLQGTPYEMGYQHGQLLRDEIASLGDTTLGILRFAGRGLALANVAEGRSFPYASEECRGMADAVGDIGMIYEACMVLAYGDVYQDAFGYTLPQVLLWEGCSQFVAANEASRDGYLYHGSTVDSGTPIDYIMNNPVVFVRQPSDGLLHTFVTYPGVVWPNSGLNVAGITLGLDTALAASTDELSFTGASNVQLMAQVLQGATTFDEVIDYFASQPRVRPNIIMTTDGKSKQAGVMEFTGQHFGVRPLQENGVLYATNHFALPEMYDTQAPPNASSLLRFQRYSQLLEPDGSATHYGAVDPQVMTQILRDRTNPETLTPSPFSVFDDNASPSGNSAHRQATFDPGRLHLWVAAGPAPVPENPFVCFSLEELLNFSDATPCPAAQIN